MARWFAKPTPSVPPVPPLMDKSWRDIAWKEADAMKINLKTMEVRNPDVNYLRILVHGPVGAGKSSFINSINSIFQENMVDGALTSAYSCLSFTKMFKVHPIRDGETREPLRFVFCDVMGFERGDCQGAHPDDLIKVLHGQIKDGHKFNPVSPTTEEDSDHISNQNLDDQIHCLLSVIPADTVAVMTEDDFRKIMQIREKASAMGIPQLTMLTKVDMACNEVQMDIRTIYRSRKIKEIMQKCSNKLGIPMTCIFPVKNYHEEIDLNPDVNALLLSALKRIVNAANNYVESMVPPPANKRSSNSDQ